MTKVMKKALALVLALTMVFSTVIVSNAAAKKTNKVTVNGVATTKKLTVKKGKTIKLTTGVKKCTVKSSKKSVVSAKVSKKTVTLKAKKVGTSKVTISKKGYKNVVVTVKVAKKAPTALKTSKKKAIASSKSLEAGKTWTVTANQKVKAATSKKSVATVKVSGKKVTVSAKAAGKATVTIYNSTNAAVAKKVTITVTEKAPVEVTPEKATVTAGADGKYTIVSKLPATPDKIVKVSAKVGNTAVELSGDELKEITTAVTDKKVVELITNKVKGQKDKTIKVAGKDVTVVSEYDAAKGADLKYAGKTYNVKADNAAGTVTVNGKTAKYDAAANTVTYTGLTKAQADKAQKALDEAKYSVLQ